jgi:glycosyltransferase involved in cell wall biosynthesis
MIMQNNPLVSVIIPAYNHELYIEEALQSVIDQTYPNIELIVINDGSTDKTAEIIQKFVDNHKDFNMQFINKKNEGVCETLNKGIEMSKGEYISFLASDDLWLPNKISVQVEYMERNRKTGMVFSDAMFILYNDRTDIKWSDYKPELKKYFKNGMVNDVDLYYLLLTRPLIPALTVLVRKSVINKVGLFDKNLVYEDNDMWLRIAREYPIAYIDIPLAYYRLHNTNVSNDASFMLKGMMQTVHKHFRMEPLKSRPIKRFIIFNTLVFNLAVNRFRKRFMFNKN